MEKKVGIVSCYFQHNYGSMLQAYATQRALDKLNIPNETINIEGFKEKIRKSKIIYFIKASLSSKILGTKLGMVKNFLIKRFSKNAYTTKVKIRNKRFDDFSKKMIRLSEKTNTWKELTEKCSDKYSTVLVGSDQLWLPANIAADYYTLSFVPTNINTIAYATSFGQSILPRDSQKKASVFLKKIEHISVREESGQRLVKQIVGRKVPIVCDPTLLFTGEEWMHIQKKEKVVTEPYIFCYFLGNNLSHRNFASRLKEETGCKIVALIHLDEYVKYDNIYADMTPYNIDPSDFLNLICNASYICTDSYHCIIFSVLYQKNFFPFYRYSKSVQQSTNDRLDSLFKMLGMNGLIKNGEEDIKSCIEQRINYVNVLKKIEEIREKSFEYLQCALFSDASTDFE